VYEDNELENDYLIPQVWQYTIRHHSPWSFQRGEKVFLTCCPDVPLTVLDFFEGHIKVYWYSTEKEFLVSSYPPECLLQYRWRPLITYIRKYNVCLN